MCMCCVFECCGVAFYCLVCVPYCACVACACVFMFVVFVVVCCCVMSVVYCVVLLLLRRSGLFVSCLDVGMFCFCVCGLFRS